MGTSTVFRTKRRFVEGNLEHALTLVGVGSRSATVSLATSVTCCAPLASPLSLRATIH